MPQIIDVPINQIAINPYRRLHAYPYIESKIEALQRSIADVGLWPSVMARPLDDKLWKYELAFGHHRIEAARRSGLKTIPLIVEPLTDKQMLQYMGRENLEDYNASFLIQLESWEAALKSNLVPARSGKHPQSLDIAVLLGWVEISKGVTQLNATARACNASYGLLAGGHMSREELDGLTVSDVRRLTERTFSRMEYLEQLGKENKLPRAHIEREKKALGRAASETANQIRAGTVAQRDIHGRVDFNYLGQSRNRPSPLLSRIANEIADNLRRTLQNDGDAQKLAEIEKVLTQITMLEDWEALGRIDLELHNLGKRTEGWRKRLAPTDEKIIHFKALEGGRTKP